MDESDLNRKLDDLNQDFKDALGTTKNRGQQMKAIWNDIRTIGKDFKEVRFATANSRQESWQKFQEIVRKVKEEQENYFKNKTKKETVSKARLEELIGHAERAWPHPDGFSQFLMAITGAGIFVDIIMTGIEMIIEVATFGFLKAGPRDDRKAELDSHSFHIKKAWAIFKEDKEKMTREHRDAAWKVLSGTQGELDKEWTKWKQEKQEKWEKRKEYYESNEEAKREIISEMRGLMGRSSAEARGRAKELFQEWRTLKSAGREKDEELWSEFKRLNDRYWEENKEQFEEKRRESFREHAESQIEKLEGMLDKAKSNRDSNRERLESAYSDGYREKVLEWISNDEAYIEKLETWIDEWRDKL